MATKTQTPIAELSGAIDMFHEVHHPEVPRFLGCTHEVCTDARAALEDVEALVESLRRRALAMEHIAQHLREKEVSVRLEADDLDSEAAKARATLAKFQEAQP